VKAGADPRQIVLAGVGKTRHELRYALETGVAWINVESGPELERLIALAAELGARPQVALRINPSVQADTHHYIATGHAAAKFGIPLAEADALLGRYVGNEHVTVAGLHVHIGSQLQTTERTVEAIRAVLPLIDRHHLHSLNIGGGFPVSYMGDPVPPVEQFAVAIYAALKGRPLRLMIEPGRYIVADAGALLVEVQYVKPSPEGMIVVADGGMTELIRPALYQATHAVLPLQEVSAADRVLSHVVGPVCESADVLCTNVQLPPLEPGALLAILHVGAYGAVMGSTYNARPRPPEVLVESDHWQIVRQRETWDDLVRLES
jgi:diaminopimelate decarboxylase